MGFHTFHTCDLYAASIHYQSKYRHPSQLHLMWTQWITRDRGTEYSEIREVLTTLGLFISDMFALAEPFIVGRFYIFEAYTLLFVLRLSHICRCIIVPTSAGKRRLAWEYQSGRDL